MLNKRDNKFAFEFPKGFLDPGVLDQFQRPVGRMPLSFADPLAYLNWTVQDVDLPGFDAEQAEQLLNQERVQWKPGVGMHRLIDKVLTVQFRLTDGMINWFMMLQNASAFLESGTVKFHPDFTLRVLDNYGFQTFAVHLRQPQISSMTNASFSFSNNSFDSKTFTATFKYNRFEVEFARD